MSQEANCQCKAIETSADDGNGKVLMVSESCAAHVHAEVVVNDKVGLSSTRVVLSTPAVEGCI
jgi:hypothetical protein